MANYGIHTFDGDTLVYKYVDIQSAHKIIENGTLLYQLYKNFNDPLDPHFAHLDLMTHGANHIGKYDKALPQEMIDYFFKDADNTYENFKHEALSRLGILCLSLTFKSTLMWSHYADKHKGVCFGFRNIGDNSDFNLNAFKVKYAKEVLPITFHFLPGQQNIDAIINMICTKADVWKYEEEVRILNYIKPGFYPFSKSNLSEVHFGVNCSNEDIISIKQLLAKEGYQINMFGRMKTSKKMYELESDLLL